MIVTDIIGLTLSATEIHHILKVLEVIPSTEKPSLSAVLEKETSNSSSKMTSGDTRKNQTSRLYSSVGSQFVDAICNMSTNNAVRMN